MYCTGAAEQKKIAAAFAGHFVSLGAHVIGARTVESILQIYAPKFTRGLKAEFYGSVSGLRIVIYNLSFFFSSRLLFYILMSICFYGWIIIDRDRYAMKLLHK